jgi:APA family basic amino acid/polyamine antiporter
MADGEMRRTVGVVGVVVTLVGFVIGASIFILPGVLAATAGPGVVLSYCIAGVMALFSCVVAAQVGAVFPTSGGGFVALSRLLSPFWGFTCAWFLIGGISGAIGLVAYGFADYAQLFIPMVDRVVIAVLIILALTVLNLLGIKGNVIGQGIMVAVFMAALLVFCVAGLISLDPKLLVPFMPNGLGPVLAAAVPAAFSFSGFMVVIELGGEVKNPSRTMPIGLGISFLTVLLVYVAVSISVVGLIPWQELEGIGAPVAEASSRIMPDWTIWGITLAMLAASASSINVLLLGFSRDILAVARTRALPDIFARLSSKTGVPVNGVLLIAALSLVVVAVGGSIAQLATLTVVALLLLQSALSVAALQIPNTLPDLYRNAGFRLGPFALRFFCFGLIAMSLAFLVRAVLDDPLVVLVSAVYLMAGVVFYLFRRSALNRRGVDVEQLIRDQVQED